MKAETLHPVPQLSEGGSGAGTGQTGPDDDDADWPLIIGADQFFTEPMTVPFGFERSRRHFGIEQDHACTTPNATAKTIATFPTTTSSATSGPAPRKRRSRIGCSIPNVCRLLDKAWLRCNPSTTCPAR